MLDAADGWRNVFEVNVYGCSISHPRYRRADELHHEYSLAPALA
jgi:hypothetical protein